MINQLKRRLPPYAREVIAALDNPDTWPNYVGTAADGSGVTLWVTIGPDAWQWASERREHRHLAVAIPPDADPEAFNWEFLAGHGPLMLCVAGDVDRDQAEASVRAFIRDGVQSITYLPNDVSRLDGYVAEGVSDAA